MKRRVGRAGTGVGRTSVPVVLPRCRVIICAVLLVATVAACESAEASAANAVLAEAWPQNVDVTHRGADRESRFYVGLIPSVDEFAPQPQNATATDQRAVHTEDVERVLGRHYLASWRVEDDGAECFLTSYQVESEALWSVYGGDQTTIDALRSGSVAMVELIASCGP